jgi:hypothetical protein
MNRIAKVWEELDKKQGRHANLSKSAKGRGVHLNVADDMRELSRSLSEGIEEVERNFEELAQVNYDYQEALERAQDVFGGFRIAMYEKLIETAYDITEKVEQSAKDLGLDPSDMLPSYDELVEKIYYMEGAISNLEDEYSTSEFGVHGLELR